MLRLLFGWVGLLFVVLLPLLLVGCFSLCWFVWYIVVLRVWFVYCGCLGCWVYCAVNLVWFAIGVVSALAVYAV